MYRSDGCVPVLIVCPKLMICELRNKWQVLIGVQQNRQPRCSKYLSFRFDRMYSNAEPTLLDIRYIIQREFIFGDRVTFL